MCDVPILARDKVSPERLRFGLSRIDCSETRYIELPYIRSLKYLFCDPPVLPKVKVITFLVDTIPDLERLTNEMTEYLPSLPRNLSILVFDIEAKLIDDGFKKKNAFSSNFQNELKNLRSELMKKKIQFNMSLCKKCTTPIDLKGKCMECNKQLCSKCDVPRRCVMCIKIHCDAHIRSYCRDCGRNFLLCRNCKQKEYDSCLECDRTFCEKHEKFMLDCKICGEVFCDSKKCTYLCDGCDQVSCNDCELRGCPNCGKKFCAMCVNNNNCFVECEVCETKICEKCMKECLECLAQICKWCEGRCCLEDLQIFEGEKE